MESAFDFVFIFELRNFLSSVTLLLFFTPLIRQKILYAKFIKILNSKKFSKVKLWTSKNKILEIFRKNLILVLWSTQSKLMLKNDFKTRETFKSRLIIQIKKALPISHSANLEYF